MAFGDYATLRDNFEYFECGVTGASHWSPKILSTSSGVGCINVSYTGTDSALVTGAFQDSTPAANFESYFTFNNITFGRGVYLFGRLRDINSATPDGYYAELRGEGDGTHIYVQRWDNGSSTLLADSGSYGAVSNNDQVGLMCQGSSISAWVKHLGSWTQVASAIDTTYATAGPCGIGVAGSSFNVSVDDFFMGDIPAPAAPQVLSMQAHVSGHNVW